MTLHEELCKIRETGVPLEGICTRVSIDHEQQLDDILREYRDNTTNVESIVFPIDVQNIEGHGRTWQYHAVREDVDVTYKHTYLCERWALLNYLINETE